jgi:BON domain/PRC-barrel domain
MRKTNITATLVAGSLALAASNLLAQDQPATPAQVQPSQDFKQDAKPPHEQAQPAQPGQDISRSETASSVVTPACQGARQIIGMAVLSQMGDRLGRVQDLIVTLDSDRAPVAVIRQGGLIGIGGTRIAVPLNELKLSFDHTTLTLAATRNQLASASPTPIGAWAGLANQDWAKNIDRFYGQPPAMGLVQFERQGVEPDKEGHEFVRTPEEQRDANDLQIPDSTLSPKDPGAKPADSELTAQVSKLIEQSLGAAARKDIQVTVEKGVVTLNGKVADGEGRQTLDALIKALTGVNRLDDQLTVSTRED